MSTVESHRVRITWDLTVLSQCALHQKDSQNHPGALLHTIDYRLLIIDYRLPKAGMQNFSVQGLMDALAMLDPEVTEVPQPEEEYVLLLEVTITDRLGCLQPSAFSWNSGMVLHVLKRDPTLRDLEHVQVDGPGTAYLFFYDKQGQRGLKEETAENLQARVTEAFPEWISHSAHFMATLLPLAE